MPAAGASSRGQIVNSDGTHLVQCWLCRRPVCRTTAPISRLLCAICEASEAGKPLTEEAIRAYEASRANLAGVSMLLLDDPPPKVKGLKKWSLAAVGEGMSSAMGFLRRKPDEAGDAAVLARSKRRGKLLAGLTEEDVKGSLGSMTDVDAMLRQNSEEG